MNTKAKSPPVSIAPHWALESIAGNTATIRFDDETTLTLAVDISGMDISIMKRGQIAERVTLAAASHDGRFKTSVTEASGRKSQMTGTISAGCVALDYSLDAKEIFVINEPLPTLPASFARAITAPAAQPDVPVLTAFFAELNTNPYVREQVLRFAGRGIGPVAIDFCDAVCAMCWGSGGTHVHACLACIFCNGFTTAPPTAP